MCVCLRALEVTVRIVHNLRLFVEYFGSIFFLCLQIYFRFYFFALFFKYLWPFLCFFLAPFRADCWCLAVVSGTVNESVGICLMFQRATPPVKDKKKKDKMETKVGWNT